MKKLEVGDYVKNLTEKQFDKLMELQPSPFCTYKYSVYKVDNLIFEGCYMDFLSGAHGLRIIKEKELTYRQFLGRAKKTFVA